MTMHKQVPFKTLGNGAVVGVDEGMLPLLIELQRLGVKTQYSCQGKEDFGGYVLADYNSFRPVLRKIKRNLRRGSYSPRSQRTAKKLFSGMREWSIVWFNKKHSESKLLFRRGLKSKQGYSLEVQLDNFYGLRTTIRWPVGELESIRQMLVETK